MNTSVFLNYLNLKADKNHTHPEYEGGGGNGSVTNVVTKTEYEADKIVTNQLIAKKANIEDLKATNAEITNLKAENAVINNLVASKADIIELDAQVARIENLYATKAEITELDAVRADINVLNADSATINNLLAGNLTAGNIQAGSITSNELATGTITAGSGVIADGAIGNAQISKLSADKLEAGTIDTSKVVIQGSNGHMRMRDNRFQVFEGIGSNAFERVSLGDVNGDGTAYGFRVRGKDGTTILYDENGVREEGITDGAITNEKISNSAEIDGAKLNIASVINKINEDGTGTIEGFKVSIDGTNLDTKLERVEQDITEHTTSIKNNTSKIEANEEAIKLKVSEQIYQEDKTELTSQLDRNTSSIEALQGEIALKVEQTHIENAKSEMEGIMDSKVQAAKGEIKVTTDSITQSVTNLTQTTNTKADKTTVNTLSSKVGTLETSVNGIKGTVSNLETTTNTLEDDLTSTKTQLTQAKSQLATLDVNLKNITQRVSNTESTVSNVSTVADSKAKIFTSQPIPPYKLGDIWVQGVSGEIMKCRTARASGNFLPSDWDKASKYTDDTSVNTLRNEYNSTKSQVAEIVTDLDGITQRVSDTETTTSNLSNEISGIDEKVTSTNNKVASIETNLNGITQRVSNVETKSNTINNNLSNLQTTVTNTNNKVASIETNLNGITQRVSSTETNLTTTTNKLNNLQIGGRNLLKNSKPVIENSNYVLCVYSIGDTSTMVEGEKYTISFDGKLSDTSQTGFYVNVYDSPHPVIGSVARKGADVNYHRYTITAILPKNTSYTKIGIYSLPLGNGKSSGVKNVKLEKGDKATDWTPAPEDVQGQIDTHTSQISTTNNKVASIETNLNGITQRVSSTESTVSTHTTQLGTVDNRINTAKNSAISTASSDATTKANNALASAKTDATTKANNALADAKTYTNGQITTVNQTINNKVAEIKATTDAITQRVSSTETKVTTHTTQLGTVDSRINSAATNAISNAVGVKDTRNDNQPPSWYFTNYPKRTVEEFKYANKIGIGSSSAYGVLTTVVPWTDSSGGFPTQTFRSNSTSTYERKGTSATAWGAWTQIENTSGSQAKATQALNDAKAYTTTEVSKTNSKVASIETNLNGITQRVSNVETTSTQTINLAKAMSNGKILHTDVAFRKGVNNINVYNNSNNGTVTISRIAKISDCPTTSTHCLEIKTTGTANPGNGGFHQIISSRANAIFIQKFIAKVPSGLTLNVASNPMGTGYTDKWLTSNKGTGKWEEYIREVRCGSTGSFSSGGHVYVSGASPSSSSPLIWYLASCTTYDITDTDERVTDLTTRMSSAESKITSSAIINTVSSTIDSKVNAAVNTAKSQIKQTTDAIQSTVTNINNNYASKSQLTQTVNDFEYKFQQSCANLLYNSSGRSGAITPWWHFEYTNGHGSSSYTVNNQWSGYETAFCIYQSTAHNHTDLGIAQTVSVTPHRPHTLIVYVAGHRCGINVGVTTANNGAWVVRGADLGSANGGTDLNNWHKVTLHFTPTESQIHVRITMTNSAGGNAHLWMKRAMLVEGTVNNIEWSPNPSEVMNNITNISSEGIRVSHDSGSYSIMNNTEFYQANETGNRTLSMRYGGTRYYKWANDLAYVGGTAVTRIGYNDEYGINMFGTGHSHFIDLGFASDVYGDTGATITPWIRLKHWENGIYINKPLRNRIEFVSGTRVLRSDNGSWGGVTFVPNNTYKYCVGGDQILALGNIVAYTADGDAYTTDSVFTITRDVNIRMNSYAHWNFNWWTMYNMNTATVLNAQSEYLRSRHKDINEVYDTKTTDNREIRCKGKGEYTCIGETIIEIPQIIAENIQDDYQVHISKYGFGDYYIKERNPYYFVIEADREFSFDWEVVATQIEKPQAYTVIANTPYQQEAHGANNDTKEDIQLHSKYALMSDDETEIELLKENNELYKLYSKK